MPVPVPVPAPALVRALRRRVGDAEIQRNAAAAQPHPGDDEQEGDRRDSAPSSMRPALLTRPRSAVLSATTEAVSAAALWLESLPEDPAECVHPQGAARFESTHTQKRLARHMKRNPITEGLHQQDAPPNDR